MRLLPKIFENLGEDGGASIQLIAFLTISKSDPDGIVFLGLRAALHLWG